MNTHPEAVGAPWTIGRLLSWTTEYLANHGVDEPRLATEVLLAHAAECSRIHLYTRFEEVLNGDRLGRFREWVKRAAQHEPIAYLVEEKEFYSLAFRVTPDVLIPRPETEALVEAVVDHGALPNLAGCRILELGTGSGCIVVALLKQLPAATAVATDVSSAALAVARANAERHGVQDRLRLLEADRLALPAGEAGPFDVLVSNPPYVASETLATLHPTVRDFEPRIALTDGGDGLSFYHSIASEGRAWLTSAGVVFLEIADGAHAEVVAVMAAHGAFELVRSWKDRVTGRDRVVLFRRTNR